MFSAFPFVRLSPVALFLPVLLFATELPPAASVSIRCVVMERDDLDPAAG